VFVALINAVIWCSITAWLFPGFFWEMTALWIILILTLVVRGTGFWEVNSDPKNQEIEIKIDGNRYTGTINKKDPQ